MSGLAMGKRVATFAGIGAVGISAYLWGSSGKRAASRGTAVARQRFNPDQDYPDLSKHNNVMATHLTRNVYSTLRDATTPRGWTLDQCIQTGVDNPGHPFIKIVGIVAGDEESYQVPQPGVLTLKLLSVGFSGVCRSVRSHHRRKTQWIQEDRHSSYRSGRF